VWRHRNGPVIVNDTSHHNPKEDEISETSGR
jgi:hypothetical protein